MKFVVDAMCAEYGGIRTYVDHLLGRWTSVYPEDELHIVVPEGSTLDVSPHTKHELRVRHPTTLGRPLAQSAGLHRVIRLVQPDAVLATMPSTTVRNLGRPLAVVVHDLRHELRPEQFSAFRRLLRRFSYGRSYRLADGFIAVSSRSLQDLHDRHAGTRLKPAVVAHHGADHVFDWPTSHRSGPSVAFAHHTNKNPDLIIDAWDILAKRGPDVPPLMIVGVRGNVRAQLESEIASRLLDGHIVLAPFLPDEEFHQVLAGAEMIVFPSDFEGFGLPVVEGMAMGKPVVIGPEKATLEIAGGHAMVMTDWSAEALADAVTAARALSAGKLDAARIWGEGFTWDATVAKTRSELVRLCSQVT